MYSPCANIFQHLHQEIIIYIEFFLDMNLLSTHNFFLFINDMFDLEVYSYMIIIDDIV